MIACNILNINGGIMKLFKNILVAISVLSFPFSAFAVDKNFSNVKASILINNISKDEFAPIQEKLWKHSGFFVQKKSKRIGAEIWQSPKFQNVCIRTRFVTRCNTLQRT